MPTIWSFLISLCTIGIFYCSNRLKMERFYLILSAIAMISAILLLILLVFLTSTTGCCTIS